MSQRYLVHYQVSPENFGTHLLRVIITVRNPPAIINANMPKWIPGSYKIRDYARNVINVQAKTATGDSVKFIKTKPSQWQFHCNQQNFTIEYSVYAFDLSVRGAYLDDQRLFLNHCAVFMDLTEFSDQPRSIEVVTPPEWEQFTTLSKKDGLYNAPNYNVQNEHPIECSQHFLNTSVEVNGIAHQMTYTGVLKDDYCIEAMAADVGKICTTQMQLFGGSPLSQYHFLTFLAPNCYGGLEHLDSTALMASPEMMLRDESKRHRQYIDFLGLCSHEYFHLWNIKRLRPKTLMPYQLDDEQPTEMLWMFEGFTSYYDELMLCRSGVIDADTFLNRLAETIGKVTTLPGRFKQSLAESSFDAWIKLYQADANARNFMISYYSKGSLFACYLDLWLRLNSNNQTSLDDVMRDLWQRFACNDKGIDETDVLNVCKRHIASEKQQMLDTIFKQYLHGTDDLPLAEILAQFAIEYSTSIGKVDGHDKTTDPGFNLKNGVITTIDEGSQAAKLGLSINDKLIAIDNQPLDTIDCNQALYCQTAGQSIKLSYARLGQLYSKVITLSAAKETNVQLKRTTKTPLNDGWLACWLK